VSFMKWYKKTEIDAQRACLIDYERAEMKERWKNYRMKNKKKIGAISSNLFHSMALEAWSNFKKKDEKECCWFVNIQNTKIEI
jgi:predicted Ser/Thr protein kinase